MPKDEGLNKGWKVLWRGESLANKWKGWPKNIKVLPINKKLPMEYKKLLISKHVLPKGRGLTMK